MANAIKRYKVRMRKRIMERIFCAMQISNSMKAYRCIFKITANDRVPQIRNPQPSTIVSEYQHLELMLESQLPRRCIQRFATWLGHARQCTGCADPQCRVIRKCLIHERICQLKRPDKCMMCLNLRKIKYYHKRRCPNATCPVPRCMLHKITRNVDAVRIREADFEMRHQRSMALIEEAIESFSL